MPTGDKVLALNFLGEVEVIRDGTPVALPHSRKTRALLAYLAITGRRQRRDRLCTIFWDIPNDPRGALRWSLSKLRPLLDEPGHRRIVADRDAVALDLSQTVIDAVAVRERLGRPIAEAPTETLQEAAAAFRGEFLQGLDLPDCGDFQAWCAGERQVARALLMDILRALVTRLTDEPVAAIPHAQDLVGLAPLDESARATLIRLLVADGRKAEAEQHYATGMRVLERPRGRASGELARAWIEVAETDPGPHPAERSPKTTDPASPNEARTRRTSVAVLPFDNLSSDPDQDYFVDGIVEDVITNLARNRWLTVIARNSTFAYKEKATDVRQVARDLGVRYIVEGSVRRVGDRVRITAQLIHAPDGDHIWAERYDRDLDDIFQLQDEIANQIAATIEPQLVVAESLRARGAEPENLDAWDLYLRGTWHLYTFTEAGLEEAKNYFERAIELDPDLAAAYGRLAYVHVQRYWYGPFENRDAEIGRAFGAARRAIALDERDALGHFALGRAYALRREFGNGASELRRAVDLNPNFAQAHFALGQVHYYGDRLDEALKQINTAITLSPHDQHIWTFYMVRAFTFCKMGDLEAAERSAWAAVRQANATHWAFAALASILGLAGKKDEAGAVIGELLALKPEYSCAYAEADFDNLPGEKFTRDFVRGLREVGIPETSGA